MTDTVAAYWGPRRQDVDEAAGILSAMLVRLAELVPAAGHWFQPGSAEPDPSEAVDPADRAALAELLRRGVNRRDMDQSVIEELGWSLRLWNGDREQTAEVAVHVGATSSAPGIGNSAVVNLPSDPESRAAADAVFRTLVEAWEPDRASWLTRPYRRSQPKVDGATVVGWQTYLTGALAGRVGEPPAGVTKRPLADGEWLTVGPEPGEESMALAAQLAERLA